MIIGIAAHPGIVAKRKDKADALNINARRRFHPESDRQHPQVIDWTEPRISSMTSGVSSRSIMLSECRYLIRSRSPAARSENRQSQRAKVRLIS